MAAKYIVVDITELDTTKITIRSILDEVFLDIGYSNSKMVVYEDKQLLLRLHGVESRGNILLLHKESKEALHSIKLRIEQLLGHSIPMVDRVQVSPSWLQRVATHTESRMLVYMYVTTFIELYKVQPI